MLVLRCFGGCGGESVALEVRYKYPFHTLSDSLFIKYINPVALAADSGVHSQTIRAISKGIVVPKIETMIKLSNFFDAEYA
jgi:hypothetical protein